MTVTGHPARRSLGEQNVLVLQHIRCEPPGEYEDVLRRWRFWAALRLGDEREARATLAAIAAGLNSDGIATAQGGALWHPSTVRAVLSSIERDAERAAVLANLATKAAA